MSIQAQKHRGQPKGKVTIYDIQQMYCTYTSSDKVEDDIHIINKTDTGTLNNL